MNIRSLSAAFSSSIGIFTYVLCIGISTGSNVFFGGIEFPYISDTGREGAAYYVFGVGLAIVGCGFIIATVMNVGYISDALEIAARRTPGMGKCQKGHLGRTNKAAVFFSVIASICAALLAWFSVVDSPSIHNYSAYVFFVFFTVYVCMQTAIFKICAKFIPEMRIAANVKLGLCLVYTLAFLFYIPVGLALVEFPPLSLDACENKFNLTSEYCEGVVDPSNQTQTLLFDYTITYSVNLMRSITQFICAMSLLAFVGTFSLDPKLPTGSTEHQKLEHEESGLQTA